MYRLQNRDISMGNWFLWIFYTHTHKLVRLINIFCFAFLLFVSNKNICIGMHVVVIRFDKQTFVILQWNHCDVIYTE